MRIWILSVALLLSACGFADTGTAAATAGKLKADEARQGQETKDRISAGIAAAADAEQQRRKAIDQQ